MKARRPARRPAAVIFDMDGLMLDTESLGAQTWREAAAGIGVEFDLALVPSMIGRNYRDCREMLRAHYGPSYPVEQLTAACLTVFDAIVARDGIAQKPGLPELLDWLEGEHVVRAVATSTRRERAEAQLARQGLLERFSVLVGGNEVENGKPAPDIFLLAAARIDVPAADCVVLEDSEPGMRAALAAGMMPIMVPDLHGPSPALLAREPLVLTTLHDVRVHLAKLPP
jgi:beta-phosphoglucomutase-like phosphatase (HAD superfamily)